MSEKSTKLKEKFDPEEWSVVYDFPDKEDKYFIFRRGSDIVADICFKISRTAAVWLDIGCGTGHLSVKLSSFGLSVIGIDSDKEMIQFAGKQFLRYNENDKLKFIQASAYQLPFNDNEIDGVVAVSLTGCLSESYKFFQETYRVLRRNGIAIITFTNRDSLLLKLNWYLNILKHSTEKSTEACYNYRLYSSTEVVEDLCRIGFEVHEIRYYNFFLNFGKRLIPPKTLSLYLEGLGRHKVSRLIGRNFVTVVRKV